MMKKIGWLGLARTTFDMELAAQTSAAARARLAAFSEVVGDGAPLTDAESAQVAAARMVKNGAEALVVAQLTFTDADAVCKIAAAHSVPLVLWAFPEPRTGGRLRLNSPCGINLAAHALGKIQRAFGHLHRAPDHLTSEELRRALDDAREIPEMDNGPPPSFGEDARAKARRVLAALNGSNFARIGNPPDGFSTCDSDPEFLRKVFGAKTQTSELAALFAKAERIDAAEVAALRKLERETLQNFDEMDPAATEKTLRLRAALRRMADDGNWSGAAVRCWPEMFTEFGGACCGAMSALGGEGVPCACEADLHGAVSARMLQELADSPAFLADWVDCAADGTAAFWHCGLAPAQMAGEPPRAALHSNRKMPLLREFALKPGAATVARLTMARNRPALAAARGEMISAPRPFGGTCGVFKFARPAREVFDRAIRAGMEHHFAIVYGDVLSECAALAAEAGIPFFPLCPENRTTPTHAD